MVADQHHARLASFQFKDDTHVPASPELEIALSQPSYAQSGVQVCLAKGTTQPCDRFSHLLLALF